MTPRMNGISLTKVERRLITDAVEMYGSTTAADKLDVSKMLSRDVVKALQAGWDDMTRAGQKLAKRIFKKVGVPGISNSAKRAILGESLVTENLDETIFADDVQLWNEGVEETMKVELVYFNSGKKTKKGKGKVQKESTGILSSLSEEDDEIDEGVLTDILKKVWDKITGNKTSSISTENKIQVLLTARELLTNRAAIKAINAEIKKLHDKSGSKIDISV